MDNGKRRPTVEQLEADIMPTMERRTGWSREENAKEARALAETMAKNWDVDPFEQLRPVAKR